MATQNKAAQAATTATVAAQAAVAATTARGVQAALLAGTAQAGLAVQATANTTGKSQKLAYAVPTTMLRLNAAAAGTAKLKQHLSQLQAAFGTHKVLASGAVLANLAANKVANPGRVWRQSQRAGVLLLAS